MPGATIGIAHGRLSETELEEVMLSFVAGTTDILLATTIIESGLDIPRANTIFIDEANGYGLADLHQLRGRVGRSHHRAWCYLLVDETARLTQTAAKRLHAVHRAGEALGRTATPRVSTGGSAMSSWRWRSSSVACGEAPCS